MKTSKIIFISLLSAMALLVLITMVDMRLNSRRNSEVQKDFKMNRKVLRTFKVLCINESMNTTLIRGDSSYLEVTFLKDSIEPKVNYTIKDDTMMLNDFEKKSHHNVFVRIHATDSLKSIQLKNSDISIERLGRGGLSIAMDNSSLWLNQYTLVKTPFQNLAIVEKNHSNVNSSNFKIDSVKIDLNNSKAELELIVKKISGNLSDGSYLSVRHPEEISLKKDATSKINVNDY